MLRLSGLKTNNISSLMLIAGDLSIITRGSYVKNSLLFLKSADSLVIVAQLISIAVTLFPLEFDP